MVASKSFIVMASALGAMAIPIHPTNVSPGLDIKPAGSFSAKAIPNANFKPNGPAALKKVLGKYNLPLPNALRRRQDGSVVATPATQDTQYICPVKIGDSTTLNLDFDTGSADLWVFSSEMSSAQQKGHDIYTPGSTAKKVSGATWKISYGDGSSASGDVYEDTVTIGQTVVKNQAVELAKTVSDSFATDTSSDGLVGLAFGSINTVTPNPVKTFFENAMSSLSQGVMTADLRHQEAGSYDFGTIDKSKYTGSIQYAPVDNSQGFWQFDAKSYIINNQTHADTATAIADTGTTLLLVSNAIAKSYYASVKGAKMDSTQGGYTFPCSSNLPDIGLSVGSKRAIVPGSWINYAPTEDGGSTCFGGLQGYDGSMYIYGDIFFKAFFSVFDYENKQFGFAAKSS